MNESKYIIKFTKKELQILIEAISLMSCKHCIFKKSCLDINSICMQIWKKIQHILSKTYFKKKS